MMKKFFSKYFLIVAMVAAVGCISSCKDYNDEMNAKIDGVDATLQKLIEKHQDAVKDSLENARKERDELKKSLDKKINDLEDLYVKKSELEKLKEELGCTCTGESGCTCTGSSCTCTGGTTSCVCPTDQIEKNKQDIEALLAKVNDETLGLAALNARIETLDSRIKEIDGLKERVEKLEKELSGKNFVTQEQLEELKKIVEGINSCTCDFNGLKTQVDQNTNALTDLQEKYNKNKEEVQKTLDENKTSIEKAQKTQEQFEEETNKVIQEIKNITIVNVQKDLTADLDSVFNETKAELEIIEGNLENLYNKVEDYLVIAKTYTDDAIDQLKDYVVPAIGGLEALLNEVRIDLSDLKNEVTELSKEVATNMAAINSLINIVNDLEEQRISSVNIQGAYSPVIGYFNMPMGIKSNIVAAYRGAFATGVTEMNFPFATSESMYDKRENPLNNLDLGYDGVKIDELGDGKAGKIYLVVNPTDVNIDKVKFSLTNSWGDTSIVKLSKPVASADKLTFGYTRAGGHTLYETEATIVGDALNLSAPSVSEIRDYKNMLKDLLSDVKNQNINLSRMAEDIYFAINEVTDAYAVSATWKDALSKEHTVLSNYEIAALTVEPLSFGFMQDETIETVPGYEVGKELIGELVDSLNKEMGENKFDNVENRLYKYLDKLNRYLSGVLTSVNAKLQPVLLISEDKNFALLSQSKTHPVEVSGKLTLVPTTYTGELLAPAYKKYVAITAVNGFTDNLVAANVAAGEDFNKVLDGDVREISFKGESGNTYEITYSALDYAGIVVNTKYYVTVK